MCKVNEKTYVFPNGTEKLVETVQYCSKSNKKALCNSYERIPMGSFFVHDHEPSLTEDDGFGTPSSSGGQPMTPTSTAGLEYRSPSGLERRPSSRTKRFIDASKLKISFKKESSRRPGHHASASSSSAGSLSHQSHSRDTSYGAISTTSPLINEYPERAPSGSPPTIDPPHEDRRRRPRTMVDLHVQSNPPPGSSSGGSSLSGHASSLGAERPDPRVSKTERRMAETMSQQQRRQHRREEKARATSRQETLLEPSDGERAEREAREVALDEQARRDFERVNAREEIRRQNAARRAEEDSRNAMDERQQRSAGHQHRRSSVADQAFVDSLRRSLHAADATTDSLDETENERRRATLQAQLRSGYAAPEHSRSSSDTSDRVPSHRAGTGRPQAERRHGYEANEQIHREQTYTHPPIPPVSPGHRSPPVAYRYARGPTPEDNRRSWHQSDVSARNPNVIPTSIPQRRPSISRRPSTSSSHHPPAPHPYPARPGSSSSRNNAAWTQDREALRRRGEEVLAEARARGSAMDRAQEASFRMGDAMFDDDDEDYAPEDYYRRAF